MHDKPAHDRRVQKTRTQLLDALGTLIHEKPYDAIVVQEILDRANVGRSTFYTHFRDKDGLLQDGIRDLVRSAGARTPRSGSRAERVLRFSLPVFEHIDRHRRASEGRMTASSRATVHEQLRHVLAQSIAEDVRAGIEERDPGRMPPDLLIRYVTTSFVSVLNWWVESRSSLSAMEIDHVYRALVLPGLSAALD